MIRVQASNPRFADTPDVQGAEHLGEMVETVFMADTEVAILFWGPIPVRISYKWDFGIVIEDWIKLVNMLHERRAGTVSFPSSTFNASWDVTADDLAMINPHWNQAFATPPAGIVSMNVNDLLAELLEPLRVVARALEFHGIGPDSAPASSLYAALGVTASRGVFYR